MTDWRSLDQSSLNVRVDPSTASSPSTDLLASKNDGLATKASSSSKMDAGKPPTAVAAGGSGAANETVGCEFSMERNPPWNGGQPAVEDSNGKIIDALQEDVGDSTFSPSPQLSKGNRGQHVLYISTFAVFGTVIRVFTGRLFGGDCGNTASTSTSVVADFVEPWASLVCVTANGKTDQTGGALFTDLPANMLGSFLIGVLSLMGTHRNRTNHPLPWFRADHPLQRHTAFHVALVTGLCGCLTTFASWNTQMVVMLDGTDTVLGSQPVPALFGYLIGISTAATSFLSGRHCNMLLRSRHRESLSSTRNDIPAVDTELGQPVLERPPPPSSRAPVQPCWLTRLLGIRVAPFLVVTVLIGVFVVGDVVYQVPFYRKMWISIALTPLGALLRWRLSRWNSKIVWNRLAWVPWGTLVANLLAAVLSAAAEAIGERYYKNDAWTFTIWKGVGAGFAGSLSTVSTMVKEMFAMDSPARAYFYATVTVIAAALLSLAVYSPIIRS